jgi:hypothetical protein
VRFSSKTLNLLDNKVLANLINSVSLGLASHAAVCQFYIPLISLFFLSGAQARLCKSKRAIGAAWLKINLTD